MGTAQHFSITLPSDMADAIKSKVATGEYETEGDVIRDGLRTLMARDRAIDLWLENEAGPAYDAIKADPTRAITVGEVRESLALELKKANPER